MRKHLLFISLLFLNSAILSAQDIILNRGFEDLAIGISHEKVNDIIGFNGKELSRQEYIDVEMGELTEDDLPFFKAGFDKCLIYKHIMPIPVTKVFLKNNKVVALVINSYPSFSRPVCLDTHTKEGIKFWDSASKMEAAYGNTFRKVSTSTSDIVYYYYDSKGIGFGISNNEVRIIEFF